MNLTLAPDKKLAVFIILVLVAAALYVPLLWMNLESDDFQSIHRVVTKHIFVPEGFFRPLSDITLFLNYFLGGYSSASYHIFNLLVHIGCSFLLYNYCLKASWIPVGDRNLFGWMCSLFFLVYPFHNEAIVWCVGRGASLATLFALAALLTIECRISLFKKYTWCGIFYFAGLCAFESIIFLPIMVLIIQWSRHARISQVIGWVIVFAIALLANLVLRYYSSHSILGGYAQWLTELPFISMFSNFTKAAGRLLLPPSYNSSLLIFLFAAATVLILSLIVSLVRQIKRKNESLRPFMALVGLLVTSMIVPAMFAVSTVTSESDRLLYFPSVFVCLLLAYMILSLIKSYKMQMVASALLLGYFVLFLELNNRNWLKASSMTQSILETIKSAGSDGSPMILLNVPDEHEGAYIFRNGFPEALLINGIDTSGILRFNRIDRMQMRAAGSIIKPVQKNGGIFIYPVVTIRQKTGADSVYLEEQGTDRIFIARRGNIWYWNKRELVQLD